MEQRIGWEVALASLSLAFALSLMVAWVYQRTHAGLSYLRSFTQSLALAGIISAAIMLAIGDDIARGLGVVGALTIVRFRTTLKDTRDLMFVFASLAAGVACGVQSYVVALIGAGIFSGAAFYLSWSDFGAHHHFDAVLRLRAPSGWSGRDAFARVLDRHCRRYVLVNLREAGSGLEEHSYQVQFAEPGAESGLLRALDGMGEVTGVNLLMQDSSLEP